MKKQNGHFCNISKTGPALRNCQVSGYLPLLSLLTTYILYRNILSIKQHNYSVFNYFHVLLWIPKWNGVGEPVYDVKKDECDGKPAPGNTVDFSCPHFPIHVVDYFGWKERMS